MDPYKKRAKFHFLHVSSRQNVFVVWTHRRQIMSCLQCATCRLAFRGPRMRWRMYCSAAREGRGCPAHLWAGRGPM